MNASACQSFFNSESYFMHVTTVSALCGRVVKSVSLFLRWARTEPLLNWNVTSVLNQRRVRLKHVGLCARNTAKQSHSPRLRVLAPSWKCSHAAHCLIRHVPLLDEEQEEIYLVWVPCWSWTAALCHLWAPHTHLERSQPGEQTGWRETILDEEEVQSLKKKKNYCVKNPVSTFF